LEDDPGRHIWCCSIEAVVGVDCINRACWSWLVLVAIDGLAAFGRELGRCLFVGRFTEEWSGCSDLCPEGRDSRLASLARADLEHACPWVAHIILMARNCSIAMSERGVAQSVSVNPTNQSQREMDRRPWKCVSFIRWPNIVRIFWTPRHLIAWCGL
jgi:hypothetical protein